MVDYCSCGHSFGNNCAHRVSNLFSDLRVPTCDLKKLNAGAIDKLKGLVKGFLDRPGPEDHNFLYEDKQGRLRCAGGHLIRAADVKAIWDASSVRVNEVGLEDGKQYKVYIVDPEHVFLGSYIDHKFVACEPCQPTRVDNLPNRIIYK
jgi:hypothetical protein